MGWNSWNTFGCDINEQLTRETADSLVSSGMRDAGYRYVNIDDCWAEPERDAAGELQAHHERFPSGIKAIADYVHERGLELGIYTSAGTRTCADSIPGALGHEETDARTFAEWGVDSLKYDNCHNQGTSRPPSATLRATGRPIVYSVCESGESAPWEWAPEIGTPMAHHRRHPTGAGNRQHQVFPMGVIDIIDFNRELADHAGPGAWNDPDMLEVGVHDVDEFAGLTDTEAVTHFSMWSIMASPLIAGNDVRAMPPHIRDILTNREVIAVDQDELGEQGTPVRDDGDEEVWVKPLANGDKAVALFNRGPRTAMITTSTDGIGSDASTHTVRDLWHRTETTTTGEIAAPVPSHGAFLLRISPRS
ncbi:glycoside hydrolase family 27 protein [Saccharopolyspora sp. ID03-671]|uniref:glycoside hydrolase family 27 protein n=1 Tax=Saccharopolyspora sp. ID03-671 TaxID=3073066 RepID=UPI0032439509